MAKKKLSSWIVYSVLVLLAIAIAVAWLGKGRLNRWRSDRMVQQAEQWVEAENWQAASIALRRAIQLAPYNIKAARGMARLAQKTHAPEGLGWWQRVTQWAPEELEGYQGWAEFAMEMQDWESAELAFTSLPPSLTNTVFRLELGALLAMRKQSWPQAQDYLDAAMRLEPENPSLRLNRLKVDWARSGGKLSPSERDRAVAELEELQQISDRVIRIQSLRMSYQIDPRNQESEWVKGYLKRWVELEPLELSEELFLLELEQSMDPAAYSTRLERLKIQSAATAGEPILVAQWLNVHAHYDEVIQWASHLAPSEVARPMMRQEIAIAYLGKSDFSGMKKVLEESEWGDLDFLRWAYLSVAENEGISEPIKLLARQNWERAVRLTGRKESALVHLAQLAALWRWSDEFESLWWEIAQGSDKTYQSMALTTLQNYFYRIRNATDLLKVYELKHRIDEEQPSDLNNRIALSLLTGAADQTQWVEPARLLHEAHPDDILFASTYSLAVGMEGRWKSALKILHNFPNEDLYLEGVGFYYGLILTKAGYLVEGEKVLDGIDGAKLFSEENQLLESAKDQIRLGRQFRESFEAHPSDPQSAFPVAWLDYRRGDFSAVQAILTSFATEIRQTPLGTLVAALMDVRGTGWCRALERLREGPDLSDLFKEVEALRSVESEDLALQCLWLQLGCLQTPNSRSWREAGLALYLANSQEMGPIYSYGLGLGLSGRKPEAQSLLQTRLSESDRECLPIQALMAYLALEGNREGSTRLDSLAWDKLFPKEKELYFQP